MSPEEMEEDHVRMVIWSGEMMRERMVICLKNSAGGGDETGKNPVLGDQSKKLGRPSCGRAH
jgi:hypothetical protein